MSSENLTENRTLKSQVVIKTIEQLKNRVFERFGERGLTRAARDLYSIAKDSEKAAEAIAKPDWPLRMVAYSIIAIGVYGLYRLWLFYEVEVGGGANFLNFAQGLEAMLNMVLLCVLAIAFVVGLESRYKRRRALKGLHELRSIAHVIDMHQLTKDPKSMMGGSTPTPSSPKRDLSRDDMLRYLDYCTEMLSLTGKLAALYGEKLRDAVVIGAVNDIEDLTTGLSRKIWQKILVIQGEREPPPGM